MCCYLFGYIGAGTYFDVVLNASKEMVPRSAKGYGFVSWSRLDDDMPDYLKGAVGWMEFLRGPALSSHPEVFSKDDCILLNEPQYHQTRKCIMHGRYATIGDWDFGPEDCHPHLVRSSTAGGGRFDVYLAHNGTVYDVGAILEGVDSPDTYYPSNTDSAAITRVIATYIRRDSASGEETASRLLELLSHQLRSGAVIYSLSEENDKLFIVRREMPLLAILSESGTYLVSDISAIKAIDSFYHFEVLRDNTYGFATTDEIQVVSVANRKATYGIMSLDSDILQEHKPTLCPTGKHSFEWDKRIVRRWNMKGHDSSVSGHFDITSGEMCLDCACEVIEHKLSNIGASLNDYKSVIVE